MTVRLGNQTVYSIIQLHSDHTSYLLQFCRVTNDRKHWIPLISAHLDSNIKNDIYICDLHFNENDFYQTETTKRLKPNATPELR